LLITDTHTHLFDSAFDNDRGSILENSLQNNVKRLFLPNVDEDTLQLMFDLAEVYPSNCFPIVGLHPCSVKENWEEVLLRIFEKSSEKNFYAIGETGLDFYWDRTFQKQQIEALEWQFTKALALDLPVVLHTRESFSEVCDIIEQPHFKGLRGVFHCFSGDEEDAKRALNLGFYLGFGGVVTYKKSHLPQLLPQIPHNRILLETDSPYLAPIPFRGKRNESAYIKYVAAKVAECLGLSISEVAQLTTQNSIDLFRI
jgi:TatD DNase family protein